MPDYSAAAFAMAVMSFRYEAHFIPEEWIRDHAYEVQVPWDKNWDCTLECLAMEDHVRDELFILTENGGHWFDSTDRLKYTPTTPEWIRDWSGPFTITVRRSYS